MRVECEWGPSPDLNNLTAILVAVLRSDGHLCNVLNHVGRGDWQRIEAAIRAILAPRTRPSHLDSVADNVLELICDGRGVTGPVMQSVFFGTIARKLSPRLAGRLRDKVRRLRRKVAAANLASREQAPSRVSAEAKLSVHPRNPEQGSGVGTSERPGSGPSSARSDKALSILHTPVVRFDTDGIYIDAALIADGLGLDPASVPPCMQTGEIRSVCERGIDADDGRYRLTFFRPGHRVRLVVGTGGQVHQRSSIAFGRPAEVVQQLST